MKHTIYVSIIITISALSSCGKKKPTYYEPPLTYPNTEISISVDGRAYTILVPPEEELQIQHELGAVAIATQPACIGGWNSGGRAVKYEVVGPSIYAEADVYVFILYSDGKEVERTIVLYEGSELIAADRKDIQVKIQPRTANKNSEPEGSR